eukprot:CAMPEP_0116939916 /NCGR_PEP_ID=MMETSP0467-20121206/33045_1 /TAXON_ID=283647 /ORGANISM="Mesodinium pulex, Strain SPMC105" /LENGTH=116 /DNA_ID=CAMNT_0004622335 /DNA_START=93 /DNA_END=443 /DNA_ORIENTATION=+
MKINNVTSVNDGHRVQELQTSLDNLKEDFEYNLKLIYERDSELEFMEKEQSKLQALVADKNAYIDKLLQRTQELETHSFQSSESWAEKFKNVEKESNLKSEKIRNLEHQLKSSADL